MKVFVALLIGLIGFELNAQTPFSEEVEWGQEEKAKFKEKHPRIIGEKNGQLFGMSSDWTSRIYLHTISKGSLSIEESVKLDMSYNGNTLEMIDVTIFGGELVFLTAYRNKSDDIKYFFIQKYVSGGKMTVPVPVGEMDWSNLPGYFSVKKDRFESMNVIKLDISDNKKFLSLVYPVTLVPEDGEKNTWNAVVFDESFKEVWNYPFELESNALNINMAKVNDQGVVLAASVMNKAKNARIKFLGALNYDTYNTNFLNCLIGDAYYLEVVDGLNKKHKHVDLGIENKEFIGFSMDIKADKVIFYGIAKGSGEQGKSSFILILNEEGDQLNSTYSEINQKFFDENRFKGKSSLKKGKDKKLNNFFLNEIYQTDAGDLIFIAEEFHYSTTSQYDPTSKLETVNEHFIFGDLLFFSYSSQGDLNWINRYEKLQLTTNDQGYFSSYFAVMKGGSIHIIANTKEYSVKEEELDNGPGKDKRQAKQNSIIAWIEVKEDGTLSDDVLITKEELENHTMGLRYGVIIDGNFYAASNYFPHLLSTGRLAMGKIGVSL